MNKRGKLEIIRDILKIIQENHNSIQTTPLIRKSNLSTQRFSGYLKELIDKKFVEQVDDKKTIKP